MQIVLWMWKEIANLPEILFNPFPTKGFPIDEYIRLAFKLDRVKSISALSAHSAGKALLLINF